MTSIILAIECAEAPTNLDKRKKLFDTLMKEIIFDGESYLIVLKTCNIPDYSPDDEQKEKSRIECDELRARFETLSFGDLENTRVEPRDWNMWRYFGLYMADAALYYKRKDQL